MNDSEKRGLKDEKEGEEIIKESGGRWENELRQKGRLNVGLPGQDC